MEFVEFLQISEKNLGGWGFGKRFFGCFGEKVEEFEEFGELG